jgi:3-oxoacyl-[acyl-carrier protein] reductase
VVAAGEVPLRRVLDGRVALVTGAARGIGRSIARRLAEEGAQVVVLDRPADAELASAVAREVGGVYLPCDVTADDSATTVHDFLAERFGHVDIVVHNAGVTRDRTLGRMKPDLWDQVIDVNLAAVIELTDALSPLLADEARIVCLSSIAGIAGNVGQTNYAASKAGVIGYVRALAPTLAARGIAVNAIAPGFIETRLTDAIPVATREVARRLCNLSQGGLPVDIAQVATFLASPGAHGLSGQVVRVCGGNFVGA